MVDVLAGKQAGKRRGRPAVYLDDADRQAAHRERAARRAAVGDVLSTLTSRPTPAFVKLMISRLIEGADDPAAARAELAAYLAALEPTPTS